MDTRAGEVKVWDLFIRIFHWTVAAGFFLAYLTEDLLTLHVWSGYVIGGLLVLRVFWGIIGPRHARFTDFVYRPATVAAYLRDLIGFRAKRYIGHSPAGGAMVLALMIALAVTVWTGLELYAVEEKAGPLAAISFREEARPRAILARSDDNEEKNDDGEGFWEELHEVLANLTMVLVIAHIAGVGLASVVHRENLARAMVTGFKRV